MLTLELIGHGSIILAKNPPHGVTVLDVGISDEDAELERGPGLGVGANGVDTSRVDSDAVTARREAIGDAKSEVRQESLAINAGPLMRRERVGPSDMVDLGH